MKVNITGKGIIPCIGTLAPKYNVELTKEQIERILRFPHYHQLVITDLKSGFVVNLHNIDQLFQESEKVDIPPIISQKPKKIKKEKQTKQEVISFEETETVVPEINEPDVVLEVTSTSEKIGNVIEVEKEPYVEPELIIEETTNEEDNTSEEESTNYFSNKKKRKNRR